MVVEMKGIVLAGGTGTRLLPLTLVTNKHLLPVYNKPMIYYPIETLVGAGITDILIISGRGHAGHFLELLGSGKEFGATFSYGVQESAGGIAQALGLAEGWADDQDVAVILGDNIFQPQLNLTLRPHQYGAKIFLKEVSSPERFGVPVFNNDHSIQYIEEKPLFAKSCFAVTGLYLYDRKVFSYIRDLKPSDRGELEITDVNNKYASQGDLAYEILKGYWSDAGTFDSLIDAGNIIRGEQ
jgi:glucose-1-phosphate thymidylyltransferase